MGKLTTHVLDTANGCPAAGMQVVLSRLDGDDAQVVRSFALDGDGRAPGALLEGDAFVRGRYRLLFSVGAYFAARGADLPDPPFLGDVALDFGIASPEQHYHVPLLASPWSYSTYRGS